MQKKTAQVQLDLQEAILQLGAVKYSLNKMIPNQHSCLTGLACEVVAKMTSNTVVKMAEQNKDLPQNRFIWNRNRKHLYIENLQQKII